VPPETCNDAAVPIPTLPLVPTYSVGVLVCADVDTIMMPETCRVAVGDVDPGGNLRGTQNAPPAAPPVSHLYKARSETGQAAIQCIACIRCATPAEYLSHWRTHPPRIKRAPPTVKRLCRLQIDEPGSCMDGTRELHPFQVSHA
jgi:hypothetical protein